MKERLTACSPTFLVIVFLLSAVCVNAQCESGTEYRGCQACGTARSVRARRDNLLKNRDEKAENVKVLSISDIRDPTQNGSFFPDMAVEITGYVAGVVSGSVKESANCGRQDLRNLRILLVASPREAGNATKYVILEITPRWEKNLGWDDSNFKLLLENAKKLFEGKWVTFRGWMFYNLSFVDEAQSTNPGIGAVWRATPWEVHPVTSYNVLPGPPESVTRRQTGNTIPAIGRRNWLSSANQPPYPETISIAWNQAEIDESHAHELILEECLRSCEDEHSDKIANCKSLTGPPAVREACRRKARRAHRECTLSCVEQ